MICCLWLFDVVSSEVRIDHDIHPLYILSRIGLGQGQDAVISDPHARFTIEVQCMIQSQSIDFDRI
jgi:hypothetical protein